jgi:hypothetical protein
MCDLKPLINELCVRKVQLFGKSRKQGASDRASEGEDGSDVVRIDCVRVKRSFSVRRETKV